MTGVVRCPIHGTFSDLTWDQMERLMDAHADCIEGGGAK